MIRAILRAQWLSMRLSRLASGRRRAVFTGLIAVLWYGFWTFLAAVAEELTAAPELRAQIQTWLPVAMMAVCAYWQLAPLASANMGASLDLRKMLVYPVPRRSLFLIEILLRITTCAELLLLLAGAAIGLLRNPAFGGWRLLARVPLAMLLFAAFNLMLAAGLRNLIERLLHRKGIREADRPLADARRRPAATADGHRRSRRPLGPAHRAHVPRGRESVLALGCRGALHACSGRRRPARVRRRSGRMDLGGLSVWPLAVHAQPALSISRQPKLPWRPPGIVPSPSGSTACPRCCCPIR